jgi:hypothetical protein
MTPIVSVMLILVLPAAYCGMAVLGWGGLTAFFSHAALVALVVVLFAFAGAALFAKPLHPGVRQASPCERPDRDTWPPASRFEVE